MWRYCPYIERVLGGAGVSRFTEYIEILASELEGVDNIYLDGLKEIDLLNSTIDNLRDTNEKLRGCVTHYAGEPFETNDIYMDIFDLIIVKGSVITFDSDKFSENARQCLKEIEGKE